MKKISIIAMCLNDLLTSYDHYLMKHENAELNILMDQESINFYLYDNQKEHDRMLIDFPEKEAKLLQYLGIEIILTIFGKVYLHLDDNIITSKHRPNYKIILNNEEIIKLVNYFISIQDEEFINEDLKEVQELRKQASKKVYSNRFAKELFIANENRKNYMEKK